MSLSEIKNSLIVLYRACHQPLNEVLQGISTQQLYWKPAPESRSIGEIARHLIRVDNWFLQRLGYPPQTTDPDNVPAEKLLLILKKVHHQVEGIVNNVAQEEQLTRPVQAADAGPHDTLVEIVVHMAQHYLYHLAQMIYLRRAQDREWESPIQKWEEATYVISDQLWFIRSLLSNNWQG